MDSPSGFTFLLWGGTEIFVGNFRSYPINTGVAREGTYSAYLDLTVDTMATLHANGFVGQSNMRMVVSGL